MWLIPISGIAATACVASVAVPDYPRLAHLARIQGEIRLTVTLDQKGRVSSIESHGSAHALLVREAERNLRRWDFCPRSATFEVTYEYRLTEPPQDNPEPAKVSIDIPDHVQIRAHPFTPQP
jgi:TonB family protein